MGKNSIQFDTIGKLVNISKIELNELLSNTEDSYVFYLLELAMEMKLVTTIPSIGVTTFQSTDNANDVLKMDNRKLLNFMLDGAYELTKNKIIVNNVGKKEHIKKWITEFTEVDKVMRFLMELENGKITLMMNSVCFYLKWVFCLINISLRLMAIISNL